MKNEIIVVNSPRKALFWRCILLNINRKEEGTRRNSSGAYARGLAVLLFAAGISSATIIQDAACQIGEETATGTDRCRIGEPDAQVHSGARSWYEYHFDNNSLHIEVASMASTSPPEEVPEDYLISAEASIVLTLDFMTSGQARVGRIFFNGGVEDNSIRGSAGGSLRVFHDEEFMLGMPFTVEMVSQSGMGGSAAGFGSSVTYIDVFVFEEDGVTPVLLSLAPEIDQEEGPVVTMATPEPSTLAMLIGGLSMLLARPFANGRNRMSSNRLGCSFLRSRNLSSRPT